MMTSRTLTIQRDGQRAEVVRHKPAYTHLVVASSNPASTGHDVVLTESEGRCTCKGFLFRGKCRHIAFAQAVLNTDTLV
jgi:hypothetical protein